MSPSLLERAVPMAGFPMAIVAFEAGSARVGGLAHIGLGLKLATERMHG